MDAVAHGHANFLQSLHLVGGLRDLFRPAHGCLPSVGMAEARVAFVRVRCRRRRPSRTAAWSVAVAIWPARRSETSGCRCPSTGTTRAASRVDSEEDHRTCAEAGRGMTKGQGV